MNIKPNIGAIIFARYDSKRLYGKALIDIEGRSLLGRVIDRSKLINGINNIIIATSDRSIDNHIYEFAQSEGIKTFRGSCNDVYQRSIDACEKYKFDFFARICGDRPFFDYELVSKAIEIFKKKGADLVTTMYPRTYPPGLTTEIIKKNLLKRYNKEIKDNFDREHLTTYFYRNPNDLKIINLENKSFNKINKIKLVVDTEEDLKKARWIARKLTLQKGTRNMQEIISLALKYAEHSKL